MPQAARYQRSTDFAADELANVGGRSTVRTAQVNAELDTLADSVNRLIVNQGLNQRDDGEIRDGRVRLFTLASDVLALLTQYGSVVRGAWVTATAYALKDLVSQSGATYIAAVAHTSGTFATDLAAGKWMLFSLSASPSATQVAFTPGVAIAATNVQAAIDEVDTENRALSATFDAALRADLADIVAFTKGSGQIGFLYTITYAAGTVGRWLKDLALAAGSTFIGWVQAITGAVTRTVSSKLRETISVLDFGADPTGATDSTAAFNLATQATIAWNSNLQYDILVPSGPGIKFKINGTVYVRKGQTLHGSGHGVYVDLSGNTTTSSFVLGKGLIAGVATDDAGGAPVKIENLYGLGGAAAKGAVYTNAQGFEINSIFLTSPGIGLEIGVGASDGLISNVQVDQAFNGITITNSQNLCFVNTNIYLAGTGISIGAGCADIQFNGGVIEYSTVAGVLFANGVSNIKGVLFTGVNFTMNAQSVGTFQGFVQSRASNVEAQWTGCSFRNMYKWAINHQTNGYVEFNFTGCVFDGTRTNAAYAQSTTAMVLNTGLSGSYAFNGCEFRNLNAEIATINDSLSKLVIRGGVVFGCDGSAASQKRFNIVSVLPLPAISVKGVHGFGYVFTSGSNQCCVLPWWAASTVWKVAIKGNTQAVGDGFYSAAEESVFPVTWQNNAGTKSIYADRINLWQTANRTNPGQLTSVVCLGTAPGGAVSTTTFAASGTICISVPFTNASNFEFLADTAT